MEGHDGDLDESLSAKIFKRLRNSPSVWLSEGDETWHCTSCNVDTKISKKRCFVCRKWNDGKQENYDQVEAKNALTICKPPSTARNMRMGSKVILDSDDYDLLDAVTIARKKKVSSPSNDDIVGLADVRGTKDPKPQSFVYDEEHCDDMKAFYD